MNQALAHNPLEKACSICRVVKPHSDFYKNKNRGGRPVGECIECHKENAKKYLKSAGHVAVSTKVVPLEKACTKCGETKAYTEFYKGKGRLTSQCKPCTDVRIGEYHAKNPGARDKYKTREYTMDANYKKLYGISLEDVEAMLVMQGGLCGNPACSKEISLGKLSQKSTTKGVAFLDHCHATGKVRGLLCMPCNTTLGHLESKSRVEGLKAYLRQSGQELFN